MNLVYLVNGARWGAVYMCVRRVDSRGMAACTTCPVSEWVCTRVQRMSNASPLWDVQYAINRAVSKRNKR
jgi:hypothetical protein